MPYICSGNLSDMNKLLLIIVAVLGISLAASVYYYRDVEGKWKVAMANAKSYDLELSKSNERNVSYRMTIDQLEYFKDSILEELNTTRKELRIKDKNLESMQYIASGYSKVDTVVFRDTIFKENVAELDTLLEDRWYSVRLALKYPSSIVVEPECKSEKMVIISTRKETVDPPKKWFFQRWFQRKHVVVDVDVIENNPYVQQGFSKYIRIDK